MTVEPFQACTSAQSLAHAFSASVAFNPDRVAIRDQYRSLSYAELDRLSDAVASRVIELTGGRHRIIGLSVERVAETVAGLLGIIKAGSAYLPIDATYPPEYVRALLRRGNVEVVVRPARTDLAPIDDVDLILTDDSFISSSLADLSCLADCLPAYTIFTSGTTGPPKGVVVTHKNVLRLFRGFGDLEFGFDDVWSCTHSFAFDFSVWEVWGALLSGGILVLATDAERSSASRLRDLLERTHVTVLSQTPSAFRALNHVDAEREERLNELRLIVFGGEALDLESTSSWITRNGSVHRLVNMYGITETTVHVTTKDVGLDGTSARSPIGKPLPDLRVQLLSPRLTPVGDSEIGEAFVSGAGLAMGYLDSPKATAARFLPSPVGAPGERMYRTGDLMRAIEGELFFEGRVDRQVKLRGYRVELVAVERAMLSVPGVLAAAADIAIVRGEHVLVGAIQAPQDHVQLVNEHLRAALPDFMRPTYVSAFDEFPQTANGKVDHAMLLTLVLNRAQSRSKIGSLKDVVAVFRDCLGQPELLADDRLFDVGGTSLVGARIAFALSGRNVQVTSLQVLQAQSAARVWEQMAESSVVADARHTTDSIRSEEFSLWLAHELSSDRALYNVPVIYDLANMLDADVLARALFALVSRHPMLRANYLFASELKRHHSRPKAVEVPTLSLPSNSDEASQQAAIETFVERPFDLTSDLLVRAALVGGSSPRLVLVFHHLAVDAWSLRPLLVELADEYSNLERGNG